MLPYLKAKRQPGLIIATRKADGGKIENGMEGEEDQGLMACAEDLIRAIHAKDAQAVAGAFKAAFELCETQPHDEYNHEEDEQGQEE